MNEKTFDPKTTEPIPANVQAIADAAKKRQEAVIAGNTGQSNAEAGNTDEPNAAATTPQTTEPEPRAEENYEQKFKVLQGISEKNGEEIRQLKDKLQRATEVIAKQTEMITNLQAAPPAPPAPATTFEPLNEDDFDLQDPEIKTLVERDKAVTARLNELAASIPRQAPVNDSALSQKVDDLMARQAVDHFARFTQDVYRTVAEQGGITVAEAAAMNDEKTEPGKLFTAWLAQEDGFSGVSKAQLLTSACPNSVGQGGDVQRAARFFLTYLAETGKKPKPRNLNSQIIPETGAAPAGGRQPQPANNVLAFQAEFLKAQKGFTEGVVTEAQFDEVRAKYQTALQAARQG